MLYCEHSSESPGLRNEKENRPPIVHSQQEEPLAKVELPADPGVRKNDQARLGREAESGGALGPPPVHVRQRLQNDFDLHLPPRVQVRPAERGHDQLHRVPHPELHIHAIHSKQ